MQRRVYALLAAVVLWPLSAQTWRGQIGAEVEIGEGNRSRAFTDIAKTFRPCDGKPVDQNGLPTIDCDSGLVFFHLTPYAGWNPAVGVDDPERYVPDWSGTYKLSFRGQSTVSSAGDPITIANQAYDPAADLTTADVIVPYGTELMSLKFTQRVTDLKLIRPGYPTDGSQIFTNEFLDALQPYAFLRFMGALDTNDADAAYDPAKSLSANQKKWSDRHTPADATQQAYGSKRGLAWEYVIALGNAANKDIWTNIPVSVDDDYVRQLATLMHHTLKPGLRIYIEHGNEVWNSAPDFHGYPWNHAAASAELGRTATADEGQRRHARRVAEIGKIFLDVYGQDAFGKIVRPIYAGWILYPDQYDRVLAWIRSNVGEPSALYYAVAQTHYYNDSRVRMNGATVDHVLNAFRSDSDNGLAATKALHNVAAKYGLKHVIYEGGPDILRNVSGTMPASQVPALGASIGACRDARMRDIVSHDMRDNWFALGGAEYSYFTMSGGVSRWGCWGAVEDVVGAKAASPKLDGILDVVGGRLPAPVVTTVVNAASYAGPMVPGGFASIFGQNLAATAVDQWGGMYAGGQLPAVVGGVSVRVNGKDAVVSYAGPTQINFIVPADLEEGPGSVEVIAPGGRATGSAAVAAYSPAFFANSLDGKVQLSAVFANTSPGVYVAPAGAWPSVQSRPAVAGDWIQLYATGLGPSAAPFGRVLTENYAIDPGAVSVTVDGVPATVAWAGVTFAGVFQINVQVPPLQRGGSLPVRLTIGGKSTQAEGVLTFAAP